MKGRADEEGVEGGKEWEYGKGEKKDRVGMDIRNSRNGGRKG